MKTQNRIVHVLFVLTLLLGLTPAALGAPAAGRPQTSNVSQTSEVSAAPVEPGPVVPEFLRFAPAQPLAPAAIAAATAYTGTAIGEGRLDPTFEPVSGGYGRVLTLALQPDGKIVIGGNFSDFGWLTYNGIARLNPDGSVDASFNPGSGVNDWVVALALQPDGKIIIGGDFDEYDGVPRYGLARVNTDGSLDTTFNPANTDSYDEVRSLALQPDGKLIISGRITINGGVRNVVRLNTDGTVDNTFSVDNPISGPIYASALQPDGKILVGGVSFSMANALGVARLNADGSIDTSFNPGYGLSKPGANAEVRDFALQPDGKIIIGGYFQSYDSVPRNNIARLNPDGSLDLSFAPGDGVDHDVYSALVYALTLQPDGKIVIGGIFDSYDNVGRGNIARLNTDGSLDSTFDPGEGADAALLDLVLQPDGKIVIGGDFGTYDGVTRRLVARLMGSAKTVAPAFNVPYYSVVTYTISLVNFLTQTDTIVLTDTLPVEVDFVQWLEQPAGATITDVYIGNDVLQWSGSVAAKEAVTFTFQAQHVGTYSETVTNTVEWVSDLQGHRVSSDIFTVEPVPPLLVTKSVTPMYVASGEQITYTLQALNTVTSTITGIVLTDTIPSVLSATTFISNNVAISQQPDTRYVWTLPDLLPGESAYITVTGVITPDAPFGPFANTAYVSGLLTETLTCSATATAVIVPPTYTLAINTTGTGAGVVTPTVGSHVIPHHQTVTLYATPSISATFDGWSGDPDCADGEVYLDTDKTCTATFTTMPILTIAITGTGSGGVSPTVGSHYYPPNSIVTLNATPATTSTFVEWTGDASGPWRPVTVTIDGDKAVTATFDLKPVCNTDVWHVFLGSSGEDWLWDMITDDFCNVYVTGYSDRSWGNPVRAHAPITNTGGDWMNNWWLDANYDAFVAKLDANHNVVWNTFLGGVGYDIGYSLALDNAGHLYVGGQTEGYEAEWGDPLVPGSTRDGFVAQLDAATGALNWHTFIDSESTYATNVQVDVEGNIYVLVASTDSAYPVDNDYDYSGGAWSPESQQIVKLDPNGGLLWSTAISYDSDGWVGEAGKCVLNSADHLVCTARNHATWGTPIRPYTGHYDVSVFQLNTADGTLVWNTFLGGLDMDSQGEASSIGVDADDNVYITGFSLASWGNPVNPKDRGRWVAKLDVDGALRWHTFTDDYASGAVVDSGGALYIAGDHDDTVDAGSVQLDPATGAVLAGARLGGDSRYDIQWAIAVDNNDTPLIGGNSRCPWGAPLLPHSGSGKYDAWVASWGATYGGAECVAYGDFKKTAEDVNGGVLYAGDLVRYTIAFTNTGVLTMHNAVITDTLPNGLAFVSASPPADNTDPVVWNLGTVPTGTVWTAVITAVVDGSSSYINQNVAQLTCDENCDQSAYASLPSGAVTGFALTMAITGTGSGVLSPTVGIHGYPNGTVVTLTATPDAYSTFDGWSGDADCATGAVTMTASKACTATFIGMAAPPALSIAKTAEEYQNAPPLLVNDRILYTIRVTNTTTGTLTNLIVTDTLPAGVSYFGIPKGAPRPDQTGNPVVWSLSSLAAGATQTFKVIVKATGAPTPIGDNTATATCAEDSTPRTATANLDDANVQEALTLLKDAVDLNGEPLLVDDVIRYTIYVTNTHDTVTLTGVVVTDTLPAGTVFVTATQSYTEAGGTLWWQVGDLAPGESWTVEVDQRVDGSANPIAGNHAAVWCDQQDWQGTGDVYPPDPVIKTDLALGKTAEEYRNDPPLLVGDRILYTIRVTNTTTGALTNLRITDTLPAGVSYFGIPKGSPRPDQTGNPVVWTLDSLAAGQTQTFKVIVKVDGSANPIGVNQVQATCAEETTVAAASAQVPGDGVHEPGLVVTGTVGGGGGTMAQVTRAPASALDVGDLLTYTVMVTNSNDSLTLHNLAVTVTLPSGVEWVRMTPAGSTALLPVLVWHQATLGPGMGWRATIVVSQTSESVGTMHIAAASDEQSPVEVTIGGAEYRVYLPLVLR